MATTARAREGRRGRRALCPILVGRHLELDLVRHALTAAASGEGAALVLQGEAGVGKTRLVRAALDAARETSMAVLVGRCSAQGQMPYRPLTEALLGAARSGALPEVAELRPFRAALGTVVPDWREDGGESSPVLVAEGILRLARALGAERGALLVVEDLHWADLDTLAVLEYLADNLAGSPVALLLTLRPGERTPAEDVLAALELRAATRVLELGRLGRAEVAEMVRACDLEAGTDLADEVFEAVLTRSEGLPLLVEELLAVPSGGVAEAVPGSFADAVGRRLLALPADARLVVECAAVLGRGFDWELLPSVAALDEDRVRRGLEHAVAVQLLDADADGTFRFRHALTRDAVSARTLPPSRLALAQRAARVVEAGAQEGDEAALLAADLWCAAGQPGTAAARLVTAGDAALRRGALVTADRLLERAVATADALDDVALRASAAEALTETRALAARVDDALALGAGTLHLLDAVGAPPARVARLQLVLARAADAAGRWALASEHLGSARHLAGEAGDEALLVAVDGLSAHVAIGEGRYDEAAALASATVERALALDLPEVACEALEVLGRRERLRDIDRAEEAFERAAAIARDRGLPLASVRALHELGTIDMFRDASPERLEETSELAYRAGALALAATIDLQLVGLHAYRFELDDAAAAAERAIAVAAALRLDDVHSTALLQLAFAEALAGRRDAMEDAIERALRITGGAPQAMAHAWGHARATASLLAEDRERALEELDTALAWGARAPGVTGSFAALAALLRAVEGAGPEAVDEVAGWGANAIPVNRAILELARAVIEARAGEPGAAAARAAAAEAQLRSTGLELMRHLALRLAAEAALADGWGDPARWLADAAAHLTATGHARASAACRDLLRRAGHRLPRPADAALPETLRAAGVTSREAEVLALVAERFSNREIAERLYLSPRTVEKHVERLLQKTGTATRSELGRVARSPSGPEPGRRT